jgi:hypothetical protein
MPGENAQKSLYQRLGGYDVIAAVVDDLFARLHQSLRSLRHGPKRGF